jgi:hypothetical protein
MNSQSFITSSDLFQVPFSLLSLFQPGNTFLCPGWNTKTKKKPTSQYIAQQTTNNSVHIFMLDVLLRELKSWFASQQLCSRSSIASPLSSSGWSWQKYRSFPGTHRLLHKTASYIFNIGRDCVQRRDLRYSASFVIWKCLVWTRDRSLWDPTCFPHFFVFCDAWFVRTVLFRCFSVFFSLSYFPFLGKK